MTVEIKEKLPKLYSRELIDLLFHEFYTKIQYIEEGLGISRRTAVTYLGILEKEGFLVLLLGTKLSGVTITIMAEQASGTRFDNRDEFNRIMKDCRAGKIDYIITKSVSRFGRNALPLFIGYNLHV